jgi:hypothetical protein
MTLRIFLRFICFFVQVHDYVLAKFLREPLPKPSWFVLLTVYAQFELAPTFLEIILARPLCILVPYRSKQAMKQLQSVQIFPEERGLFLFTLLTSAAQLLDLSRS